VAGAPAGSVVSWTSNPTIGRMASLTIRTPLWTSTATYPLTVTGSSGGLVRSARASLTISR
jgi:hypothetical protein